MRNKGLIIFLIIILVIIILGLIALLSFFIGNGNKFQFGNMSKSKNKILEQEYEVNSIKNIQIASDAGDVQIKTSENDKIKVVAYGENANKLNIESTSSKLQVEYKNNGYIFFGFNRYKSEIIVYIPANYENDINVDIDYGNLVSEDFENATINVKEDCGNIELGKIKNAYIKNDCGNVKVKSITNKLDIKTDCGNIEIQELDIKENSKLQCDLGNIAIGPTNDIFIDATVDLGKSNINKNNRQSQITLKVNVDCGNIDVNN